MKRSYILADPNRLRRLIRLIGLRLGFEKRVLGDIERDSGSPEDEARLMDGMPWYAIPRSPLLRVTSVGQTVEAAGVAVELLAVEVRESGAILHWRARADHDLLVQVASVSVVDDLGTAYLVDQGGGEGNPRSWQGQTLLRPAPPAHARLTIVVESFGQNPRATMFGDPPREPSNGPWRFEVEQPSGDIRCP
jgi:hypothetical protein